MTKRTGFDGDDDGDFDSGDDDVGDGGNMGDDADASRCSDDFGGSSDRFDNNENTGGGSGDADRSYKPHAADRGSSQRIAADLRDKKI